MKQYRITKIARNIIAKQSLNILDDYYIFYSDGAWIIENLRKLNNVFSKLYEKTDNYLNYISKIDEIFLYLKDTKLDDFSTKQALKELKDIISNIKKNYDKYKEQKVDLEEYKETIQEAKKFIQAYESSCVNIFKTRYMQDEDNVRNLLDTIHEKGNQIINKGK